VEPVDAVPAAAEEDIAIANYGSSNMGMLKHVYRRGLALRYGKAMQCIAGIHYNYSLDEQLWRVLAASEPRSGRTTAKACSRKLPGHDPQFPPLQLAADVPVRRLAGAVDGFLRGRRTSSTPCPTTPCSCPYATSLRMSDSATRTMPSRPAPAREQPGQLRQRPDASRQPAVRAVCSAGHQADGEWIS
jgi:glutamate--cysteine ligase